MKVEKWMRRKGWNEVIVYEVKVRSREEMIEIRRVRELRMKMEEDKEKVRKIKLKEKVKDEGIDDKREEERLKVIERNKEEKERLSEEVDRIIGLIEEEGIIIDEEMREILVKEVKVGMKIEEVGVKIMSKLGKWYDFVDDEGKLGDEMEEIIGELKRRRERGWM